MEFGKCQHGIAYFLVIKKSGIFVKEKGMSA